MADLIIMSARATEEEVEKVVSLIKELGFQVHVSRGQEKVLIGLIGDTRGVSDEMFRMMPGVLEVINILKEYKLVSREFQAEDTRVSVGKVVVGGKNFVVIAGPCSVEEETGLLKTAEKIVRAGGKILRGGAYKPRTSPYSFDGLGREGLRILQQVTTSLGIPVVTEVMAPEEVDEVAAVADMLQIGARNMFNYRLLQRVGRSGKPVLLKRGFEAKLKEFLNSAEYILKEGNKQVVLCERGIRTFDDEFTRNTLDLAAVAVLKKETHLPVIVDPSHGTGRRDLILPMAQAALAAGADGIMVEVHPQPEKAFSDGFQSLRVEEFETLMAKLRPLAEVMGRIL